MAKAKRDLLADAPYGEYGRSATEILTPEGVVLPFIKASFGERVGAIIIDFIILAVVPLVLFIVFISLPFHEDFAKNHKVAASILEMAYFAFAFFLRSGYFMAFEMGKYAATPGKRVMKLRVISHDGGQLTPAAVFTRNALREVELFMPIGIIITAGGGGHGWISLLSFLWALALLLLPVFNKPHARLGDFLAGTRVVHMPKAALSYDLADIDSDRQLGLTFTPEQLAYGEMELGVLEQVLRDRKPAVMRAVAVKIKARIGWQEAKSDIFAPSDEIFLKAYYGALRAWLENKMLLGKRRKDKTEPALS